MAKAKNIPYKELCVLIAEGASIKDLAKRYKCSGQTIRNRLYYYQLKRNVTPSGRILDQAPELTEADKAFLKRYDLTEYNK